jgi:hypothetical protein
MNYLLSKTVYVSHFVQQVIYCFETNNFITYISQNILSHVGFEIFTAVTVKSKPTVYWDLPPCSLPRRYDPEGRALSIKLYCKSDQTFIAKIVTWHKISRILHDA